MFSVAPVAPRLWWHDTYMRNIKAKKDVYSRQGTQYFWPKMTYDAQELIERCIICQYIHREISHSSKTIESNDTREILVHAQSTTRTERSLHSFKTNAT